MDKNIPWQLIISKLKSSITENDNRLLESWLSDNENRLFFQELCQVWEETRSAVGDYSPNMDERWTELMQKIGDEEEWQSQSTALKTPRSSAKMGKIQKRRFNWSKYIAAASFLIAFFIGTFYIGSTISTPKLAQQSYQNYGGKSELILPDGTKVWIHSKSSLVYNTDYNEKNRTVDLVGEAYFDVRRDKKPFIVKMNGVKVLVHGTKFNVESFPSSPTIYVSLKEGSISLETSEQKLLLHPGETATYNKLSKKTTIEKGDIEWITSWADQEIAFKDKSLEDICRFLSKWYHVDITVSPELKNRYKYTFTLRNEPLEEILRLMGRINPISHKFKDENTLYIYTQSK